MNKTAVSAVAAGTLLAAAAFARADDKAAAAKGERIDLVFVFDSTGSMGGVIGDAKKEMRRILESILVGAPRPDLRVGLVTYRDKDDEYVAKPSPLSRDLEAAYAFIDETHASAGGDWPEHVSYALHVAVSEMAWDPSKSTTRLVFLVGDAPAHTDYDDGYDYKKVAALAHTRGIVIHTIAAASDTEVVKQWKYIAATTGGTFAVLGKSFDPAGLAGSSPADKKKCTEDPVVASPLAQVVTRTVRAELARRGTVYCDYPGPAKKTCKKC